ncbi:MAG: hypothetical protein U5J64_06145 [Halobacteriales archaeon]|nr:hypothetical protein [Halobacteriales archaeon]
MDRRGFVRKSGVVVALLAGCIGGDETPENDGNGDGEENGTDDTEDGTDTDGEVGNEGEETNDEYTRFMYDPEAAGVDAQRYVFTYTSSDVSQELSNTFGVTGDARRMARVEIRGESRAGQDEGGLPEQEDGDTVEISEYGEGGSYGELRGSLSEPVGSQSGYEIYERRASVFGFNDETRTVIRGQSTERVRLVAETLAGETASYAESDDDIGVLTEAVGTGGVVLVRGGLPEADIPDTEDGTASAATLSEEGGTVSLRYAVVYPDEESASAAVSTETLQGEAPEDAEEPSGEMTPLLALAVTQFDIRVEEVDVSEQTTVGRVAVLEASMGIDAIFGGL